MPNSFLLKIVKKELDQSVRGLVGIFTIFPVYLLDGVGALALAISHLMVSTAGWLLGDRIRGSLNLDLEYGRVVTLGRGILNTIREGGWRNATRSRSSSSSHNRYIFGSGMQRWSRMVQWLNSGTTNRSLDNHQIIQPGLGLRRDGGGASDFSRWCSWCGARSCAACGACDGGAGAGACLGA